MIEVGEYIRTKSGGIEKLTKITKAPEVTAYWLNQYTYVEETDIIKHSKNIIDLIEYGDILEIFLNDNKIDRVVVYGDVLQAIHDDFIAEDIKSILTHEQYEQNCYKVVE